VTILHKEGEDEKADHVTHTVYSFNPLLYSMKPCNVQVRKLIILHEEVEDGNSVNHTVYSLTFIVLYEPCNVQVSKLIILN
jgi:hypothetical protein